MLDSKLLIISEYSALGENFRIVSVNFDSENVKYISVIEGTELPFYGVQFHPEKSLFEYNEYFNVSHSEASKEMQIYLGRFFIKEARKTIREDPNPEIPNLDFKSAKRYHGMIVYKFKQSNLPLSIESILQFILSNVISLNIGILLGIIISYLCIKNENKRKGSFEIELKGDKKGE